jgi:hypothetical protein
MPTLTRLLLSTPARDGTGPTTEVFDLTEHKLAGPGTTLASVSRALCNVAESRVPAPALSAMRAWLHSCAGKPTQPAAEVELGELSIAIRDASCLRSPGHLLQEGATTLCVENKRLKTPLRALHAQASADGVVLTLVALVRTLQIPRDSPLSQTPLVGAIHFIGSPDAELVNLRELGLGKRSSAVITHGFHASYYLRRTQQRQEHAAAMRNLGLNVAATQKTHTILLDAYVSNVQHGDRQLECVSVFI